MSMKKYMHPLNPFVSGVDFKALAKEYEEFRDAVTSVSFLRDTIYKAVQRFTDIFSICKCRILKETSTLTSKTRKRCEPLPVAA